VAIKRNTARIYWPILDIAGNCAHESLDLKCCGFAGGREDIWNLNRMVIRGSERMDGQ